MIILAALLVLVLAALAGLHLYWGWGGHWPGRNASELAAIVVGTRNRPPPGWVACAIVALALVVVAYIVAAAEGAPQFGFPNWVWELGFWGAWAVFLLRGLASYIPGPFDYAKATPFFALNRRLYGPLCLSIACVMGLLKLS